MIKTSAPGSIMLMGEHAVLHGEPAIACAIAKRIYAQLSYIDERQIIISSALGSYQSSLDRLKDHKSLSLVLAVIRFYQPYLQQGFQLDINSKFSHQLGLGSSAAVSVAVTAAFEQWLKGTINPDLVFNNALHCMLAVQGRGSGTDIAASTYGGMIHYQSTTKQTITLPFGPSIGLIYSGYKLATSEVIDKVSQRTQGQTDLYQQLYHLMGSITRQAVIAAETQNIGLFGDCMNFYQGLLDALGVNDVTLSKIIYASRQTEFTLGAKISGSGLGDCVVILGDLDKIECDYPKIPVTIDQTGFRLET